MPLTSHYWDCRKLIFLHLLVLESLFSLQLRLNAATSWLFLAPVSFSRPPVSPAPLHSAGIKLGRMFSACRCALCACVCLPV